MDGTVARYRRLIASTPLRLIAAPDEAAVLRHAPDFFEAVKKVTSSNIEPPSLALFVLGLHVVVGLTFAYAGIKRSQWD